MFKVRCCDLNITAEAIQLVRITGYIQPGEDLAHTKAFNNFCN